MQTLKDTTAEKMQKSFESLLQYFSRVRTGRASASILDDIKINYYGQPTPVKQLSNISIPEARTIIVQPWDKTTLADIERAILGANIGITPENDGNLIRLPFQPLTEDKRREIVRDLKQLGEDARVAIRNIRRDANDVIKKMQRDSEISEDEEMRYFKEIQDLTDEWIKKISEAEASKEKEIMEV
ncbi:MAG: ribosome recycling factor [Candidatus Cloacimonadaceae bacterium]|jgi:ribosome recycling factor|nr:ribosome recycling factor [Candidatus Cloacimonadota bacterium]MDY0126979.1 ribosome recycling factor [Candidatus Cloacimonadaceae bacterium]MCB5254824.1 ribosome recycling factor [Candidatus Cloacimonadota bacterium]MCK9177823.1 ribosome recycling factor [Candidatus Cloacimonadota bacterium]MCK9242435.1 ribosome recycling factor [Candidatus Cloacimonadota bacterium]